MSDAVSRLAVSRLLDVAEKLNITGTPPQSHAGGGEWFAGFPIHQLLLNIPSQERARVLAEVRAAQMHKHTVNVGSGGGGGIGAYAGTPSGKEVVPTLTHIQLLAVRMGWKYLPPDKYHTIEVRKVSDDVYVWIITKSSESITLRDEAANFPSDELCGKLRLIEG